MVPDGVDRSQAVYLALDVPRVEGRGCGVLRQVEYKAVLGESDGECMDWGQKTTPEPIPRRAVECQDRLRDSILDGVSA